MQYGSIDPRLLTAIRRQPSDIQDELLTTALIESGGRLDAIGDGGHSGGPFQENDYGRGAGIPMANRMDADATTKRASREFQQYSRKGLSDGALAYAAQRPADKGSYLKKYAAARNRALAILGQRSTAGGAAASTPARKPPSTSLRASAPELDLSSAVAQSLGGQQAGKPMDLLASLSAAVLQHEQDRRAAPAQTVAEPERVDAAAKRVKGGAQVDQMDLSPAGDYTWANQLAKKYGLSLASTYRSPAKNAAVGGSKTSAHMSQGAATDFSGTPAQMAALARWAMKSGQFREVFYDPIGQWDNGRFSKKAIGGHSDHVHITR